MEKPIKPGRVTALACILMLLVIVFVVALYKLQIVDGKAYYEENRNSVASSQTVEAARGSILDRYGHVLVSNTSCNNLVFNPDDLFEQDDPNGILLQMARTVAACGDTYVDELPVTAKPPFEYTDMNDTQRTQLKGFLKYAGLDEEATAVELMSYCREKFEINNNYSAADMRIIAGLRYSIKTRYIDKLYLPDYVFVQDASMELITSLKENNVPGFEVTVSYTRQYHTNLAAHLLGYTGKMNAEEYTTYKTQGYPMSATVGKDGAELAFEKYLHGTNGTAIVTKNASGTVTGTTYTKEPEPGDQVSLTIDRDLQAAIGQSYSLFTPLQLAEYCATIANGGTRHSASILKSVRSYDGSELIYENQAEVLSAVETSDYNWAAVQKGMYLVANDRAGSAYETFGDYGVKVAAKTGTAQLGDNQVNNAIFICYAPYDNPKVAVAVVVEHGSAGASIASIARDFLDAYFTVKTVDTAPESELSLLQ